MGESVTYQFEYGNRVRSAFIGAGGHSYRNVYPTFQYAPVDLVAVCDSDASRARAYARTFGAPRHFSDHRTMLECEAPEAVFIVTGYDPSTGRVQATDLALDCLRAGAHVWMEKPAAASVAEVEDLRRASTEAGRFVVVGMKKIFTPAYEKVEELAARESFGPVSSIYVRYPVSLPPPAQRVDLVAMRSFLDHIYHAAAVMVRLLGPARTFSHDWEAGTGTTLANLRFASGAIGALHLVGGAAPGAPLERVEVIGRGANVVVENGVRVTYYRPGVQRPYGREASFLTAEDEAPLQWEPEFSLGELYNKNLFYLGYVQEVLHFCRSVLSCEAPTKGTLEDSLAVMRVFEAYQQVPAGTTVTLPAEGQERGTRGA